MPVIVQTQHIENYGMDNDEPVNYWKFKGGSEYLVEGTDWRPANAVALVANNIARFNSTNFAKEIPTHWEVDNRTVELISEDREEWERPPDVLQYTLEIEDPNEAIAPI